MTLNKNDKLEVIHHRLLVNGKEFLVQTPDEPMCSIEEGKLITLVIKGCGISISKWDVEEIEGYYLE